MVTDWHIAGLGLVLGPGLHPVVELSLPNPPPPIVAAGHKPQTTWPTVHQCWQQLISTESINSAIENNYQQLVISLMVPQVQISHSQHVVPLLSYLVLIDTYSYSKQAKTH